MVGMLLRFPTSDVEMLTEKNGNLSLYMNGECRDKEEMVATTKQRQFFIANDFKLGVQSRSVRLYAVLFFTWEDYLPFLSYIRGKCRQSKVVIGGQGGDCTGTY